MPRQDSLGRWISDDGLFYWDGAAWRPLGAQPAAAPQAPAYGQPPAYGQAAIRRSSPWPAILIGCGVLVLVVVIVGILLTVVMVNNADFQRGFCESYKNSNANLTCPFSPPPATP